MSQVQACRLDWKPWYKRGNQGNCFTYELWDADGRAKALKQAELEWNEIIVEKKADNKPLDLKMQIIKTENSFNTVLFVALVPFEIDRNGDIITDIEITKTAHEFMTNLSRKTVNVDHEDNTEIRTAEFVESFIAPVDIPIWFETIPKWCWIIWIKFDDDTYKAIQDGDFVGISIQGRGVREEILRS